MTDNDYFYIKELRGKMYKVEEIVNGLQDDRYDAFLYMATSGVIDGEQIKLDDNIRDMLLSSYQKKLSELKKEFEGILIQRGVSDGRE